MKTLTLYLLIISSLAILVGILAGTVSHQASEIIAGTFGNGSFIFPQNLYVNGSVGINTTTPNKKLDVVGDIHATGDICTDVSGGKCLSNVSSGSGGGYEFVFNDNGSATCVAINKDSSLLSGFPSCPRISPNAWTNITLSSLPSDAKIAIINVRCFGGALSSNGLTSVTFRPVGSTLSDPNFYGLMNLGCVVNYSPYGAISYFDTNTLFVPLNSYKQFQVYITSTSNSAGVVFFVGY